MKNDYGGKKDYKMAITYSQKTLEFLEYMYEHSDKVLGNLDLPDNIAKPDIEMLRNMAQRKHIRLLNTAVKGFRYRIDDEGIGYIEALRKEEADRREAKRLNEKSARRSTVTTVVAIVAVLVSIAGAVASFMQIWN